MLTGIALAARHVDFQKDRVKTDRQSLHATESFTLTNYVPAPAFRTAVQLVPRLDRHKHGALANLQVRGMVTFRNTKNFVQ